MVVLNKTERVILRKLLKNDYVMERRTLVKGIKDSPARISASISHLRELGYIVIDLTTSACIITVPAYMRADAFKAVYPGSPVPKEVPIEDLIPAEYNKTPLFTSKGEKEIHKLKSDYWFCSKLNQPDYITCFVFNDGELSQTIHLGSVTNFGSLVSQALREIDGTFGQKPFKKSDLAHMPRPDIVGNRRPIKAITEYLIYEKFLIRLEKKNHFQRTGKPHKVDTLDEIKYYTQKNEAATMNTGMGRFYYTEEEGLYQRFP